MPAVNPSAPEFQAPNRAAWQGNAHLNLIRSGTLELKSGSKDPGQYGPVRIVQQALRFWGVKHRQPPTDLFSKFGTDGSFGAESKAAVALFQAKHVDGTGTPLQPDGIVGDLTLGALEKYVLAPLAPPAPPVKPKVPSLLTVYVDFVVLPGSIGKDPIPDMIATANYVFRHIGLHVKRGDLIEEGVGRQIARAALFSNRTIRTDPRAEVSGTVHSHTVYLESDANKAHTPCPLDKYKECPARELLALAQNGVRTARPYRPTVYLTALFPESECLGILGATFIRSIHGVPPTILIPRPPNVSDVFWHELGHALLNSETDDHTAGTFMEKDADPRHRDKPITLAQETKMKATARSWH